MHDHTHHQLTAAAPSPLYTDETPFWRTPRAFAIGGVVLIAAAYLLVEHTAHVLSALPFLPFLACPLMHFLMPHGHGGHGSHGDEGDHTQGGSR